MEQVLAEDNRIFRDGVIFFVQLAPVAVEVERGNLAEVIFAVCEGQPNITALLIARNGRFDVIELAGHGAVLNVAEQAVLKDRLGGVRREYACLMARLEIRVRLPQLAVTVGRNVVRVIRAAEILGIALVECAVQRGGAVLPVFEDRSRVGSRFVQLIEHVRIRDEVAVEQEISRDGVAARAVAAAAARGSAAGCAADGVIGDGSLLGRFFALRYSEALAELPEAVRLDGERIVALVRQVVAAVRCRNVVIEHEQVLTDEVVILDFFERLGFAGRVGERYLFDRVDDTVNQITNREVQIYTRLRRFLYLEFGSCVILDMDRRERRGLDALCVRGGHADVVAAVGAEIALTERNGQRRNRSAVVPHRARFELQVAVPCILVLVVGNELNRALARRSVIGRDAVEPRLFFRGIVVEHDNHAALAVLVQNERLGVARVLAADSRSAESGLARQDAHVAFVIVVGEVVIPKGERTVLDEVIREVVLAGVDRALCGRAEGNRLRLCAACQRDRTRLRHERNFRNGAVIGHLGNRLRDVRAVYRNGRAAEREAVLEAEREICAGVGGNNLRVRDCGLRHLTAARSRTAGRAAARGRTAAGRRTTARGRAARSLGNRLGLACVNRLAAGLDAGNACCGGNLGAGGGNRNVIRVRLYRADLAGAGDFRAVRDDGDAVNRTGNCDVGVCGDALAGLGVREVYTALAAAQQDAAGDGDVREVDLRYAVRDNQIAVDGLSCERYAVVAHDEAAIHGFGERRACVRIGTCHIADDFGKFRAGDVAFRVQRAIRAVYIAVFNERGRTVCRPRGNARAVRENVQRSGAAAFERKRARQYGEGFLTGDGAFRIQLTARALKGAHGNRCGEVASVPRIRAHIVVTGEVGGLFRGKGAVDDGGHLRTGQQARTVNPSVRSVQQAVIHGAAQTGGGPVGREIVKILGGRGECVRYEHRAGQQQSEGLFLLQGSYPPYRLRLPEANRFSKKCPFPSERMEGSTVCLRRSALRADHAVKVNAR